MHYMPVTVIMVIIIREIRELRSTSSIVLIDTLETVHLYIPLHYAVLCKCAAACYTFYTTLH